MIKKYFVEYCWTEPYGTAFLVEKQHYKLESRRYGQDAKYNREQDINCIPGCRMELRNK